MTTPNKIADFVPFRVLQYVFDRLESIDPANGYNTSPRVTDNLDEFENSDAKHTIMVETTGGTPEITGAGSDSVVHQIMDVRLVGVSRYETEHPRRLAMSLEQDVRTALHGGVKDGALRAAIGRGCSFRFVRCEHDAGFLAPDKEAGFELTVSFKWSQHSDW